jgi:alpha-D-ribose 1-methylphosphonate 5-triphosphate synthase subunit PhnG
MSEPDQATEERRKVLAVLASASVDALSRGWEAIPARPEIDVLRQPEFGMVMARGRIGGGGGAFNLGEVTVTRATVRLATGEVGVGHVLGRDRKRALLVARFDALWQSAAYRDVVEATVIRPAAARMAEQDAATRARAAATRVNFFTMVRGEDA